MRNDSKILKRIPDVLLVLSFVAYLVLVIISVIHHENFRDEAQAWLIVRDLNLWQIIGQMKYEGHFLLWYLIIMPFVKLGFPYFTINIISATINTIGVLLFLHVCKLPKLAKCLFLFSAPVIYYFPVIARCYCLVPLSLALILMFHKNRHEKPVKYMLSILLFANVHVFMWGFVLALLMEFFAEYIVLIKKNGIWNKDLFSMCFISVMLVVSALPLILSLKSNYSIGKVVSGFLGSFIAFFVNSGFTGTAAIVSFLLLVLVIISFVYSWKYTLIFLVGVLYQFIVAWKIFFSNTTRSNVWIVMLFFVLSLYFESSSPKTIIIKKHIVKCVLNYIVSGILCVIFVVNILKAFDCIKNDYEACYSCNPCVAEFINENLENDAVIISGGYSHYSSGIIPYLKDNSNVRFYSYARGDNYTYWIWDEYTYEGFDDDFSNNIDELFNENEHLYLILLTGQLESEQAQQFVTYYEECGYIEKIYDNNSVTVEKESYLLYRINRV